MFLCPCLLLRRWLCVAVFCSCALHYSTAVCHTMLRLFVIHTTCLLCYATAVARTVVKSLLCVLPVSAEGNGESASTSAGESESGSKRGRYAVESESGSKRGRYVGGCGLFYIDHALWHAQCINPSA